MRLAVEESELFQVRFGGQFCLGFWWFSHIGGFTSPQRTRGHCHHHCCCKNLHEPRLVFHSVFSPTSLAWSQFAKPGALTQIRRVLRALLRFWRSWPDAHYRMGGGCERRTSNTRRTTLRGGLVAIPGGLANANIAGCEKVDIF